MGGWVCPEESPAGWNPRIVCPAGRVQPRCGRITAVWLDVHIAILMREHGIRRIVTNDADLHRFRFLEVVDPFAGTGRI
jgi:hypothetical protein